MRSLHHLVFFFTICFFIMSCSSNTVSQDDVSKPLSNDEGYFGIVINSVDKLSNIKLRNTQDLLPMIIGSADPGSTLKLLRVPQGEYCFEGFRVYNLIVSYEDKGFCTYVEAGEINYFGHFLVRDPVSTQALLFDDFVARLNKNFPGICKQYIGEDCEK